MAPDGKQTQIANILREGSENTKRLLEMFYFNLLVASWAENKKNWCNLSHKFGPDLDTGPWLDFNFIAGASQ